MVMAPCKGCAKREIGCRSSCEAWADYQVRKAEDLERRKKIDGPAKAADAYIREKHRKTSPWYADTQPSRRTGRSTSKHDK